MRCEPSTELKVGSVMQTSILFPIVYGCASVRMAITRSNGGPDAGTSSGGGPTDENIRNLIAEEVSREVFATIPQFFGTIKVELWAMLEERLATQRTSRARDASYKDFSALFASDV
ncbi:hypothetical protein L2E82_48309 [Cichorium intybus]|uniref:Uncharacterized protein n=1 Tax=Cichorium intybus TaxID=13427 RepID=A0ACB8YX49_CICIN|nr:hypothetical protein L2E82_48309 [Cichorium intybus]